MTLIEELAQIAERHEALAAHCQAIVDEYLALGSDPDEEPIYSNRQDAKEERELAQELRRLIAEYEAPAQEAVAVTDEMVERGAIAIAFEEERALRHFDYQQARIILTAALARPAQAAPVDRAVEGS